MITRKSFLFLISIGISFLSAQESPKLVIGIVIDQMTNDYLYRFDHVFEEGGFKKLQNEGYYYPNTFFNYMATSTGPGHASIYTGSTPSLHGIVENSWYDQQSGNSVNCAEGENGRSPENLIGSTITDMLQLSTKGESKVIGIGIKDRSAILPAGHSSDLSLWLDDSAGKWQSSAYYAENLPDYMEYFNQSHPAKSYIKNWNPESEGRVGKAFYLHDEYEDQFENETDLSFVKSSPFGNTFTFDLAQYILLKEEMGSDEVTDFLCVSFSSTDYIGHRFGPYSAETQDTYRRFDKDLTEFLIFLNEKIGEDNYLLFLTSDHGVVPNIEFLQSKKIKASRINYNLFKSELSIYLEELFGSAELIKGLKNGQVYLNHAAIDSSKLKKESVLRAVTDYLNDRNDVIAALSSHDLTYKEYNQFPKKEMQQSYFRGRSGDVLFVLQPFTRSSEYVKGTGHGTTYGYDRNVPLLWYGKGIKHGMSSKNIEITQVAATLADLLKIQRPPSCTSESLFDEIRD